MSGQSRHQAAATSSRSQRLKTMIARLEGNHGGLALSSTPKKLNLKNKLFF